MELEEDMQCNYDRYRIIVQNDCAGIAEETALRQIDIDEKYGDISKNKEQEEKKKWGVLLECKVSVLGD